MIVINGKQNEVVFIEISSHFQVNLGKSNVRQSTRHVRTLTDHDILNSFLKLRPQQGQGKGVVFLTLQIDTTLQDGTVLSCILHLFYDINVKCALLSLNVDHKKSRSEPTASCDQFGAQSNGHQRGSIHQLIERDPETHGQHLAEFRESCTKGEKGL